MKVAFVPISATGYAVIVDGEIIGEVYKIYYSDGRGRGKTEWTYRNDSLGWYGSVHTRKSAVDSLLELSGKI